MNYTLRHMTMDSKDLIQKISQVICDKKGFNILALEVGHFSSVTDYLIIAEGNVERHVMAIAQTIVSELRDQYGIRPHHVEGLHSGEWVLIDYSDILIHLFMPGLREKFQLETLWSDAKIVELNLSLST